MRVSGCNNHFKFVLSAGAKVEERSDEIPPWRGKKCDKQLTHIVRVRRRRSLKLSCNEKFVKGGKSLTKYGSVGSSFRPVSHRLTDELKSTMSERYIYIFSVNHVLQTKAII
jgi:hypothetical protein